MRKSENPCAPESDENTQNTTENQPENTARALSNLLGQLIARRWVILNGTKSRKNGAEADLSIDSVSRKIEHTRASRAKKST